MNAVRVPVQLSTARHRASWLVAACLLAAAAGAGAQVVRSKPLTGGLESSTAFVKLPAQPSGSITAKECRDCPTLRLEFDTGTQYFIGTQAVSYTRLREAASQARDTRLDVSYRLGTRTLTRLRLAAAEPQK